MPQEDIITAVEAYLLEHTTIKPKIKEIKRLAKKGLDAMSIVRYLQAKQDFKKGKKGVYLYEK